MNKEEKYYYGIYRDYREGTKIAQLCLSIDDLSCEILANPGCLAFYRDRRCDAIDHARLRAKHDGCILLELNFEKFRTLKIES